MRLLLISNMYPSKKDPSYGIFVKNFEIGIIQNGGKVSKAVIQGKGRNVYQKILKYVKFFYDVYEALLTQEYDVIYVHYMGHSVLPLLLVQPCIKKPLVFNAHGEDVLPNSPLKNIIFKLTKNIIKKSAMVVVPSNYFKNLVIDFYLHKNIFVSPSGGINLKIFHPENRKKTTNKIIHFGYISRIVEGKGWDVFLLALKKIQTAHPDFNFQATIVGDGSEAKELEEMIFDLDLQQIINYLGKKAQNQLSTIINTFDLFIFPSFLNESLGLVGLEAMACGVPVIGSDIGGISEYVKDGENGYLFSPEDYNSLTAQIMVYSKLSEEEKTKMSQNALNTAQRFSNTKVAQELYEKLLSVTENKNRN